MIQIRPARDSDFDAIWPIFHAVVQKGDTYAFSPETTREEAHRAWMEAGDVFVAVDGEAVIGTYLLKPNQPGLGSHVANAAFMVDPARHGEGVGRTMAVHALAEATRAGYAAMQFNLVVATNHAAVRLWESLGFEIVGTVPDAFEHHDLDLVDAHIMYRKL